MRKMLYFFVHFWKRLRQYQWSEALEDVETERNELEDMSGTMSAKQFLSASTGLAITALQKLTPQQRTYLRYIRGKAATIHASDLFGPVEPVPHDNPAQEPLVPCSHQQLFLILAGIADYAKTAIHFTIDGALQHLIDIGRCKDITQNATLYAQAQNIVFIAVSWITMLYSPAPLDPSQYCLAIDPEQTNDLHMPKQTLETASQPICEIVQRFGPLLPVREESGLIDSPETAALDSTLHVTYLNASTLTRIGLIEIKWVDNLSSHLSFDIEGPYLMMFRIPSYCHVNQFDGTSFARITADYYDLYSKPDDFSSMALFKEIRLSYRLIFGDDYRANRYYKKTGRRNAKKDDFFDPYLDELCRMRSKAADAKKAYSRITDFPILGPRLTLLQRYIELQNPSTIKMLWMDRRDLLRWYTFWAVAIIGGVGIVLSLGQFVLSAVQVS